ncbi:RNA-directed DNA polymerase, eukaryota, reverse transcriptase zinc-binding domain protein [Tanacetum coccineum]
MSKEEVEGEEADGIQSTKLRLHKRDTREIGKLDFARVLVEVTANDELPHTLETSYLRIDVNANNFAASISNVINGDDDGFVTVGKNNKPIGEQSNVKQGDVQNRNLSGNYLQSNYKGNQNSVRHNSGNLRQLWKTGYNQLLQSNKNMKMAQRNDVLQKSVDKKKPLVEPSSSKFVVKKNQVDLSKVLVRGSGSYGSIDGVLGEIVPVANSFQALDDQSGVYPSLDVRKDWSLRQMDFFYQNCHKCGLDPSFEDDDVQTEEGGMADEMRPEYVDGCGIRGIVWPVMQILFPMIKLFSWNIKGLNNSPNQKQVIDLLHEGNYSICALLETKVKKKNLNRVCSNVLGNWHWISNNDVCVNGTGIVVGWDPQSVRVMVLNQTSQLMNLFVETMNGQQSFFCSFVYAHIRSSSRKSLWRVLVLHSLVVKDRPWALLGDFNVILDPSERSAGSSSITSSMIDFRECLAKIEVEDLVRSGLRFTWNKSPGRTTDGLLKKLDRVLSNFGFVEKFSNANAQFLPFVVSDHSPSVLVIPNGVSAKPKPFKFANYLANKAEFLPIVERVRNLHVFCRYDVSYIFSESQRNKATGNAEAATEKKKLPEKVPDNKDAKLSVTLLKNQIGLIRKASKHPSGDSLLVEEIDVGEGKVRQVVSGLAKYCSPESLTNRLVALITNVKLGNYEGKPEDVLNPKKKQLDKITPHHKMRAMKSFKGQENKKIKATQWILIVGGAPTGIELKGEIAVDNPEGIKSTRCWNFLEWKFLRRH